MKPLQDQINELRDEIDIVKTTSKTPVYLSLPITGRRQGQTHTTKEIVDVSVYCRIKVFFDRDSGKRLGSVLCSEPTGKFNTLIVYDLTPDDIAKLMRSAGVKIIDAHENERMNKKIIEGSAKRM